MSNTLIKTLNENEFNAMLNLATNFSAKNPYPKLIKFNAEDGNFYKESNSKSEDGKTIFDNLGESIDLQIITTRKMISGAWNQKSKKSEPFYSQEFIDNYLTVFEKTDDGNKEVFKGLYSDLKKDKLYERIKFVQVLYVMYKDELCRIKLSGSKLSNIFSYLGSFINDNPAKYITTLSKGDTATNGSITYFQLNLVKGKRLEQDIIIKNVNAVNEYLGVYKQEKVEFTGEDELELLAEEGTTTDRGTQYPTPLEQKINQARNYKEPEILIEKIPF